MPELGTIRNVPTELAKRVRVFRESLGLSQDAAADLGGIRRTEWWKLENGLSKAQSARVRDAMERVFKVGPTDLRMYLGGEIDLAEAKRRVREPAKDLYTLLQTVIRNQGRWSVDVCDVVRMTYGEVTAPPEGWKVALDREAERQSQRKVVTEAREEHQQIRAAKRARARAAPRAAKRRSKAELEKVP